MSKAQPDYIDKNFLVGVVEDLLQANSNWVPEDGDVDPCDEAYFRGKVAAYSCILDMLVEGK